MDIVVENCKDCLFKFMSGWSDEEYACSIDKRKRLVYKRDCENHTDLIKFEDKKKWCPLKKEPIIISLKK